MYKVHAFTSCDIEEAEGFLAQGLPVMETTRKAYSLKETKKYLRERGYKFVVTYEGNQQIDDYILVSSIDVYAVDGSYVGYVEITKECQV